MAWSDNVWEVNESLRLEVQSLCSRIDDLEREIGLSKDWEMDAKALQARLAAVEALCERAAAIDARCEWMPLALAAARGEGDRG